MDTYFYTAVSKFNVDNLDKNILLHWEVIKYLMINTILLGGGRKSNALHDMKDYITKLKERIIECIDDLIVLLEKEIPNFYVLPLRFSNSLINKEKIDIIPFIENFFIEGIDFKIYTSTRI